MFKFYQKIILTFLLSIFFSTAWSHGHGHGHGYSHGRVVSHHMACNEEDSTGCDSYSNGDPLLAVLVSIAVIMLVLYHLEK